ncbi:MULTISPECIES: YybH family protein [unclassified Sphingobium]|uniref:YybH family protein n=1 Tax=unclassified Sphingobium TaxID=2611147 RepID=UPI000D159ADA|nr:MULTISPECIES: nuclear transport factor 2 family protein [unclassified Sphingobium]MBG6120448.1 ketosteroid isomerase-like protein [Sphingobium sp. JAI105]PSO10044.1 nuclear transport factor 2 family protein [Sphingobium sp. AEW4]TWC98940.1 ketosteroid isomerase-like protein [Sphingobium sp. AEW010]TWD18419.1 ketosteroid isomerase-like protein [Sphingobium sp. AEW013]TWD21047.1 ketosteroid isomerase-like protein [Sphingobium sp. AEW001]
MKRFLNTGFLALALAMVGTGAHAATAKAPQQSMIMGEAIKSDPAELSRFKAEIKKLYDLKEQAFADGDAETIVNRFYSSDAITVGPDGKPAIGRAAFLEEYKKIVAKYNVKVESVRTYVRGDDGYDWTNFFVTSKDGSEKPFSFIILFIWTKVDGQWVCAGDPYILGRFEQGAFH